MTYVPPTASNCLQNYVAVLHSIPSIAVRRLIAVRISKLESNSSIAMVQPPTVAKAICNGLTGSLA
jgi:hypothetical protein